MATTTWTPTIFGLRMKKGRGNVISPHPVRWWVRTPFFQFQVVESILGEGYYGQCFQRPKKRGVAPFIITSGFRKTPQVAADVLRIRFLEWVFDDEDPLPSLSAVSRFSGTDIEGDRE